MENSEQNEARGLDRSATGRERPSVPTPRWVLLFGAVAGVLFLCFVLLHLMGRGCGHHGNGSQAPLPVESSRGRTP